MNVHKEDSLYLVVDDETRLVYARAASASVATAVTLGILNSCLITLPVDIPLLKTQWDAYDFDAHLYQAHYSRDTGWRFVEFPSNLLREDLLKSRRLAALRASNLHNLEVYCRQHLVRIAEYMPDHLSAFLHGELQRCDPSRRAFTHAIEEYAEISGSEPAAAYDELEMKLRSSGMVSLRTYALQQKFMMKMNACETGEDFRAVYDELFDRMYFKAYA